MIASIPLCDFLSSPIGLEKGITPLNGLGVMTDVLVSFNNYLDILYSNPRASILREEPINELQSLDEIIDTSDDILGDIENLDKLNRDRRKNSCPVLNPKFENLPEIPGNPIPPLPDLGFLKALDIPIPLIVTMFGGYGRLLLKASTEYAAQQIKDELIGLSRGDECVIQIATKLQIAISTIADLQYLLAQPIPSGVTVLVGGIPGVGAGTGILIPT